LWQGLGGKREKAPLLGFPIASDAIFYGYCILVYLRSKSGFRFRRRAAGLAIITLLTPFMFRPNFPARKLVGTEVKSHVSNSLKLLLESKRIQPKGQINSVRKLLDELKNPFTQAIDSQQICSPGGDC